MKLLSALALYALIMLAASNAFSQSQQQDLIYQAREKSRTDHLHPER